MSDSELKQMNSNQSLRRETHFERQSKSGLMVGLVSPEIPV